MCREIQFIASKITENANIFSTPKFDSKVLITRNVLETLIDAKRIVKPVQQLETCENKYSQLKIEDYNQVYSFIYEKLCLSVPVVIQKKERGIKSYMKEDSFL